MGVAREGGSSGERTILPSDHGSVGGSFQILNGFETRVDTPLTAGERGDSRQLGRRCFLAGATTCWRWGGWRCSLAGVMTSRRRGGGWCSLAGATTGRRQGGRQSLLVGAMTSRRRGGRWRWRQGGRGFPGIVGRPVLAGATTSRWWGAMTSRQRMLLLPCLLAQQLRRQGRRRCSLVGMSTSRRRDGGRFSLAGATLALAVGRTMVLAR